jgi:hypothetical protein
MKMKEHSFTEVLYNNNDFVLITASRLFFLQLSTLYDYPKIMKKSIRKFSKVNQSFEISHNNFLTPCKLSTSNMNFVKTYAIIQKFSVQ